MKSKMSRCVFTVFLHSPPSLFTPSPPFSFSVLTFPLLLQPSASALASASDSTISTSARRQSFAPRSQPAPSAAAATPPPSVSTCAAPNGAAVASPLPPAKAMSTFLTSLDPTVNLARFTPLFLRRNLVVPRLESIASRDIDGLVKLLMKELEAQAVKEKREVDGMDELDLGTTFGNALRERAER
jgi:hypothetical protein